MAASDLGGDDALADAVRNGDPDAFGRAYDAYASVVYRFCWRRIEPDATAGAEDLLSIVFLEAWRCRDRAVVIDGSLRPWLLGVANNVVRHHRRSVRRYRAALLRVPRESTEGDHADEVASRLDDVSQTSRVLAQLSTLTSREREVLELCAMEGLDTPTVAQLLGVPHGTVKSRLARARRRLQAISHVGDMSDPPPASGHEQGERATRAAAKRRAAAWSR